eukprot:COSAG06_NODE_42490_length_381_cov_0.872340_1_plen_34_part_01
MHKIVHCGGPRLYLEAVRTQGRFYYVFSIYIYPA